jgi:hypothetical protein
MAAFIVPMPGKIHLSFSNVWKNVVESGHE